jgi:hypothetical protein
MDPTYELAAAVVARLKADAEVAAIVGTKVYDRAPTADAAPSPPYVTLGPSDAASDDAECIEAYEITMQIDCFSWGAGEAYISEQVRKLAHDVRKALRGTEITLQSNALVLLAHRITRFFRKEDDTVNTAAVTITAIVEAKDT